jgi:hypothetical protein
MTEPVEAVEEPPLDPTVRPPALPMQNEGLIVVVAEAVIFLGLLVLLLTHHL